MVAAQNGGNGAIGNDVGSGEDEMAAGLEDAIHFAHHVHRVAEQVLDQLTAQDGIEDFVIVRIRIFLGVEMVHARIRNARRPQRRRCGGRMRPEWPK